MMHEGYKKVYIQPEIKKDMSINRQDLNIKPRLWILSEFMLRNNKFIADAELKFQQIVNKKISEVAWSYSAARKSSKVS